MLGLKKWFMRGMSFGLFSSTWSLTWKSTWGHVAISPCQRTKRRASPSRSSMHWSTCTSIAFSTEIWSPRIYSSTQLVQKWSLLILVLLALSASLSKLTPTRWSLSGIVAPKSSFARKLTPSVLICGQLAASLLRWRRGDHYSLGTLRLTRFSRSLKFSAHQTKIIGRMRKIFRNLKSVSQNGALWQWKTTVQP